MYYNDVIVSLEQAYLLFLNNETSLEYYIAFSKLLRSGFVLLKHTTPIDVESDHMENKLSSNNFSKTDQIWSHLLTCLPCVNRNHASLCNVTDHNVPIVFETICDTIKTQISQEEESSSVLQSSKKKKHKLCSKDGDQSDFLDVNDKQGYHLVFDELAAIQTMSPDETIQAVDESQLKFDFDIYNPEIAKNFSKNHKADPDFYGKIVR